MSIAPHENDIVSKSLVVDSHDGSIANTNHSMTVVSFNLALNKEYRRKGSWLNKQELFYGTKLLKELRAQASADAKAIEENLLLEEEEESASKLQALLRGYEGIAPLASKIKLERRKRAQEAVLAEQTRQRVEAAESQTSPFQLNWDKVATIYVPVVQPSLEDALQVAKLDFEETKVIREEYEADLQAQIAAAALLDPLLLNAPVVAIPQNNFVTTTTICPRKSIFRVESGSLHTDWTMSATSSVSWDEEERFDRPRRRKKSLLGRSSSTKRLQKVVSILGKRILRVSTKTSFVFPAAACANSTTCTAVSELEEQQE